MVVHWVNNVHIVSYAGELARKVDGDGKAPISEEDISGRLVGEFFFFFSWWGKHIVFGGCDWGVSVMLIDIELEL